MQKCKTNGSKIWAECSSERCWEAKSTGNHLHNVLIIKTNNIHYFSNLFWHRTLHVSDSSSVHHQECSTVYAAIGICHTGYADCLLVRSS